MSKPIIPLKSFALLDARIKWGKIILTTCKELTGNTYVGGIWAKWSQKILANSEVLLHCEYINKIFYTLWIAKTVFHWIIQNFRK